LLEGGDGDGEHVEFGFAGGQALQGEVRPCDQTDEGVVLVGGRETDKFIGNTGNNRQQ